MCLVVLSCGRKCVHVWVLVHVYLRRLIIYAFRGDRLYRKCFVSFRDVTFSNNLIATFDSNRDGVRPRGISRHGVS